MCGRRVAFDMNASMRPEIVAEVDAFAGLIGERCIEGPPVAIPMATMARTVTMIAARARVRVTFTQL
jgi:hypothetical protein